MRDFRESKSMAKTLREAFAAKSVSISHSESLELIAQAFGLADWNTLAARIETEPPAPPAPTQLKAFLPLSNPSLSTSIVRPFIPGGKDYELSKRFYQALGFTQTFDAGSVAGFFCDSGSFLLQNADIPGWADNFVMQLGVADLDAWWAHIESLDLPGQFGVKAPTPPALQTWGMTVAYVFGPCGELWHVTQA
jgi:hypothetical protein